MKRKSMFGVTVDPLNTLELTLDDHIDPLNPTIDNEYIAVTTFAAKEKKGMLL